jgi:hypothetical protein
MIVNTVFGTEEVVKKQCNDCEEILPLTDFPRHSHHKDGHDNRCLKCFKRQAKERSFIKKSAPPKPECCDLCGTKTKHLNVDHCHETLTFRGWLCHYCNTGIGSLGDNITSLQRAIEYLLRHQRELSEKKDG